MQTFGSWVQRVKTGNPLQADRVGIGPALGLIGQQRLDFELTKAGERKVEPAEAQLAELEPQHLVVRSVLARTRPGWSATTSNGRSSHPSALASTRSGTTVTASACPPTRLSAPTV